ncbi:nitrile hydratase subunit beta [Albidovulum sp.]|uniref:nitrile hydratase subunit beta n=1 Tax=Albidovulum sp. TaxID=1872424 RepID=UPI001DCFF2BF|nr:nitrile hydratase subunit beta [Paracoccaceae bacterium]MCC0047011.1 nitrile hydratase subunit beta [Defluviimonas sp.]HPE24248.1 nitrile hydratase subunit beta [Albidovulum sp.]MCB2120027.1 nitrile hydratase subunit beta [Paracoccaceae bacterium]MCB2122169.1 nitrile hydratase subunit beta [Paracoccaceae bacterium]
MTRPHDMGGRYGDGPVLPEPQGIVPFDRDWHRSALALTLAAGGLGAWNIDTSRHARECLSPKDYARFSYYEKWIAALADLLVAKGLLSETELAAGTADPAPPHPGIFRAEAVAPALAKGSPYARDGRAAVFTIGDRVRTRLPARNALVDGGHTRLPSYAAGHVGAIVLCHGAHVFPDANAHGLGERPEPLYTVAFDAAALWGKAERAGDEVTLDLWESYLERA